MSRKICLLEHCVEDRCSGEDNNEKADAAVGQNTDDDDTDENDVLDAEPFGELISDRCSCAGDVHQLCVESGCDEQYHVARECAGITRNKVFCNGRPDIHSVKDCYDQGSAYSERQSSKSLIGKYHKEDNSENKTYNS